VADLAGTHELGPGSGRVLVRTGRQGLAARAGHDLVIEITAWSARVTVPAGGDLGGATLAADFDLSSLAVREGTGGAKPLTDRDRRDIQGQARKILGPAPRASFRSTRVIATAGSSGGAVEGTLSLNNVQRPARLQVTSSAAGRFRGSTTITQTSFGITPYSGFFGALKLRDELTVEFEVKIEEIPNGGG
jgi:YceI-like domain